MESGARRDTNRNQTLTTQERMELIGRIWWTWSGSNRRPLPCHGSALPAAPQAHLRERNSPEPELRLGMRKGTPFIFAYRNAIVNASAFFDFFPQRFLP